MKNRGSLSIPILIAIAIVAVVGSAGAIFFQQHTDETPKDVKETSIPYDERCPYYEPDGFRYKICLNDLLEEQEKILFEQYNLLIETNPEVQKELSSSRELWLEHRDLMCKIANYNKGGTSHSVFVWFCKINETTDYNERIKSIFTDM